MMFQIFSRQPVAQTTINADTFTYKSGTNNGFYYSFWSNRKDKIIMTLGAAGNYSVTWKSVDNFTCGKGWKTGSNSPVCYSGTFDGGSNGYLALYGWTKNPLIEYYVVESYGAWTPPGGTALGTLTSDGGTYKIYKMKRTQAPSIMGTADFDQYWSVRTSKRTSGTITTKNHFDAWAKNNMPMGTTFDYLIMETEGYGSSGSSNITVETNCSTPITEEAKIYQSNSSSKIYAAGNGILLTLPSNNLIDPSLVEIFTIAGKKVFASTIQPDKSQFQLSTPGLSAGAYYASIQNKSGKSVISFVK